MRHVPEDTGEDCCVAHCDADGRLLPSCVRCAVCRQWIRPEDPHATECPGPPPPRPVLAYIDGGKT